MFIKCFPCAGHYSRLWEYSDELNRQDPALLSPRKKRHCTSSSAWEASGFVSFTSISLALRTVPDTLYVLCKYLDILVKMTRRKTRATSVLQRGKCLPGEGDQGGPRRE